MEFGRVNKWNSIFKLENLLWDELSPSTNHKSICWNPKPQDLKMWLYLEIGLLKEGLS